MDNFIIDCYAHASSSLGDTFRFISPEPVSIIPPTVWPSISIEEARLVANNKSNKDQNPIHVDILITYRIELLEDSNTFADTKYENRDTVVDNAIKQILNTTEIKNSIVHFIQFLGAEREVVVENNRRKIIYNLEFRYYLRENWQEGLDWTDLFSKWKNSQATWFFS